MTKYVTQTIEPWMPLGALKAKADYATIASYSGWQVLPIERYNDTRFDNQILHDKIKHWLSKVQSKDVVIHQFPSYMSKNFELSFVNMLHHLDIKSAVLIHDIEPLRLEKTFVWEFELLKKYDTVIVHSEAMKARLQEAGVSTNYIIQPFFDYLGKTPTLATYNKSINFAGTFQKSPWLQNPLAFSINLFGSIPKKWQNIELPQNINYCGNFDPEDIVEQLQGGFGLIWDSDFEDKTYQTYTKYNTPHKASLYLKAGLPLIAWKESEIGKLIVKFNIGFVISNLDDIPDIIANTSSNQFALWQKNILPLRSNISEGVNTQNTLAQL